MNRKDAFQNRPMVSDLSEAIKIDKFIQRIYNDLAKETCENCISWSCEIHCEILDMATDEEFGCNRFKKVDTDG